MQKKEANSSFFKFIKKSYREWLEYETNEIPLFSNKLMKKKVFPLVKNKPVFFILIDNFRMDQWMLIKPFFRTIF